MRVLVAEDAVISRRLLETFLQKWGHAVTAAADGTEAWRLFEAGDFPIVISDWMMPGVDGLELVRRIRASGRPGYVYTILLTARSQKEDVVAGKEAGSDDFITKPFDREELRVRLRAGERIIHLEHTLAEQNRALREAQAALVQSEKLASLGQLAAGLAHEINNPISYVTNNLAVLQRDVGAALQILDRYRQGIAEAAVHPETAIRDLQSTLAELEKEADLPYLQEGLPRLFATSLGGLRRVRDIIRNLRDFARLDEAECKEVDLNAALAATTEILAHEIKKKSIQLQPALAELPPVLCHPGKLNQVFLNILLNAIQACEPGGRVEIRSRADREDAIVIEIEDDGCGIRPEHLPHIFEPFFTTKPVGEGTGLGLSVSYGIIRDHGGAIEAVSTLGKGSLFRIRLPIRLKNGA
jgi:two-component system NtrC family sensor kinase